MKGVLALLLAMVAFVGARFARSAAVQQRPPVASTSPYTPSPTAAPFVTLGYRELGADLFMLRLVGYYGSPDNEARSIAALAEAITTLDPDYKRAYQFGAIAMTSAKRGVNNDIHLRAIALLERAAKQYPMEFRYPNLAGQIYLVDLQTDDPAQRRAWDELGALRLEAAARKPNAPADAGLQAAVLQTRFGQQQRAIQNLRELLLVTSDVAARHRIIEQLSKLQNTDAEAIAAELLAARTAFVKAQQAERPFVTPTLYVLLGKRLEPGFDLATLAVAQDVVGAVSIHVPPAEPVAPSVDDGSSQAQPLAPSRTE